MAKVRIGIATAFELENELVGIGTDNPTNTLQALGNIQSSDAKAIGVSTLTTYQGFVDTKLILQGSGGAKSGTTSGEIIIEGEVTVSTGTTFTSGPENLTVTDSFTLPGISDDRPTVGTTRFNENLGSLEFYTGTEWRVVNSIVDMGTSGRAVSGGGALPSNSLYEGIQYFQIHTLGSAQFFGDLSAGRRYPSAAANHIRGIFHGGTSEDRIDYITMASAGNAVDFDSDANVQAGGTGASSSTRGDFAGGYQPSLPDVDIDYVEIMTKGTTFDFADLFSGAYIMGSVMNPTRALFAGGSPGSSPYTLDTIQQVTFANKANSIDFGNLTAGRTYAAGVCNSTRGVFGSGGGYQSGILNYRIDYVTIASAGNATDFGEPLHLGNQYSNGGSTQTRGVWCGGSRSPGSPDVLNTMSYVTIATTGNAIDFGELTIATRAHAVISDSHGGLGGF